MLLQKCLTPVVLASLLIAQGSPAMYGQQTGQTAPPQTTPPEAAPPQSATPQNRAVSPASIPTQILLTDGTDVPLVFDEDISSKTATEGDEVTLILSEDLKVGDVVVAKAGAKAQGEVTNAKKAGMMGKAGELNVRLNYLKVGALKVHLRGTKGKQGESGTTGAIVLTVLFGPIGLIKHGKDIDIKKGNALKAYVSDDINLPAIQSGTYVTLAQRKDAVFGPHFPAFAPVTNPQKWDVGRRR